MMSQNRQEAKDRERAENDFKVNLKSELIIDDLHRKMDLVLENQKKINRRLDLMEQAENISPEPKKNIVSSSKKHFRRIMILSHKSIILSNEIFGGKNYDRKGLFKTN